jgi:hypothetical protein
MEEEAIKGEAMLKKFGVIKKIGVYCYDVEIESGNCGGTIATKTEKLIIIGNNEEQLEEQTEDRQEDDEGYADFYTYDLIHSAEFFADEIMERFGLSESTIDEILGGENLELDKYDLSGKDYFSDCKLSIEELREKRRIDSEPFDAEDIISKIASEYVLTPKRKASLIRLLALSL